MKDSLKGLKKFKFKNNNFILRFLFLNKSLQILKIQRNIKNIALTNGKFNTIFLLLNIH